MSKTLEQVAGETFAQLAAFVERGGIKHGCTSATAGVSQVEINGKWYEIQMRLEGEPKSFIGEHAVIQTRQMGETQTLS